MIWILLLSSILRLVSLNQSLWLDEAINVNSAAQNSLWAVVTEYPKADFHPPGYFIILWLWTKIFGLSEIVVRLPSVFFGVLTVYTIYLIGRKLISQKLGLLAALLLAVNPLHIYYSQEARMYSFAALAVSLNLLFFLKLLKKEKASLGYYFSSLLVLSSDYLTYFIFPAQLVIMMLGKNQLKKWLILIGISFLTWIWWIPVFLGQINNGLSTTSHVLVWKEVVGSFGIKTLVLTFVKFIIGRISHPDKLKYFGLFFPAGLIFCWLIIKGYLAEKQLGKIFIAWLIIPILLAWIVSIFIPVYSYFRLLFALTPFVLLVSMGLLSLKGKLCYLALSIVLVVELFCSLTYLTAAKFQREDWRGAVRFLKDRQKTSQLLFESNASFAPFDYYAKDEVIGVGALKNFPANDENDLRDLNEILKKNQEVYLIDYLVEISDPKRLVSKRLVELGYRQTNVYNFNGIGFIFHFTKQSK